MPAEAPTAGHNFPAGEKPSIFSAGKGYQDMEWKKTLTGEAGCTPERSEGGQEDLRCVCNRLICVFNGNAVEIKCAKCKRLIRIETAGITEVQIR